METVQVIPDPPAEVEHESHQIRITTHGKIRLWVNFAMNFFEEHPTKPLLLHTRSPTHRAAAEVSPRLISVAEIIKREYLRRARQSDRDASSWSGLHQYNAIESLEESIVDPDQNDIVAALQGKNFPKQKQTALLTITLCRVPLPHLEEMGATHQLPVVDRLSKAARSRRRRKKADLKPSAT